MKIPIPCEFGERAECNGKILSFNGVTWFQWTEGIEYTYFFETNNKWHSTDFYTTFQKEQENFFEIPDSLLEDTYIRKRGYPLKGRGHAYGICYCNDKTYIEFIITSNYYEHIKVQCDNKGLFVPNGDIIFPTGWDSEEKIERAILKSYKFITGDSLVIKEPEPVQLNLFDYMADGG